jgi:hypothetical protein
VPAVAGEEAGVDQGDGRQRVGVHRRPVEPDRAAEVVQDQVDALDPQLGQRLVDEAGVAGDVVLEAVGGDGLAEVRQVEGDGTLAGARRRPRKPDPIVGRARVAVEEDDSLARLDRTRLHQAGPGAPGEQAAALDGPFSQPLVRKGARAHRARA